MPPFAAFDIRRPLRSKYSDLADEESMSLIPEPPGRMTVKLSSVNISLENQSYPRYSLSTGTPR